MDSDVSEPTELPNFGINDELAGNRIQIKEGFNVKFNTIICQSQGGCL